MKKIYILLCLIFSLTFILPTFTGCSDGNGPDATLEGSYRVKWKEGMKIPEFHTNLTNEEHLNNIQKLAKKEFAATRIYVDLVYNYKDEPQFFLVEYDWCAVSGIIIDDKYYVKDELWTGCEAKRGFPDIKYEVSPLAEVDAYDCKKYLAPGRIRWDRLLYERDGMLNEYNTNLKYLLELEEDLFRISSQTKEEFVEWQSKVFHEQALKAAASLGGLYGYAKDVNDLDQLGV